MPSSERRLSSVSVAAKCSSSARCSRVSRRGMATLTTTRRSPRRPRAAAAARAAHHDRLARLRAGGDLERHVAVERRHLDRRAERGQRRRDVDHGDEVVAVAQEALVLAHPHDHVEVAGRAAALAGVAAPRQPDALAVGDPGGMSTRTRRCSATMPAPSHSSHGCSGIRPSPSQRSHTAVRTSWPNARPRDALELAGAAAARAVDDRRARLGAVAVAASGTARPPRTRPRPACRAPPRRGRSRPRRRRRRPGSAAGRPRRPPPPNAGVEPAGAEERREEVARTSRRPRSSASSRRRAAPRGRRGRRAAPLGVGEHLVGLRRLLELLLGVGVVRVDVRVQLARELAERLLDLASSAPRATPSDLVVVARHQDSP